MKLIFDTMTFGDQVDRQTAAAMRWLGNHSRLDSKLGDGIILGASNMLQLRENIAACQPTPLEQSIIDIMDCGWETIKPNCFRYFRP